MPLFYLEGILNLNKIFEDRYYYHLFTFDYNKEKKIFYSIIKPNINEKYYNENNNFEWKNKKKFKIKNDKGKFKIKNYKGKILII
jgi:hypothetical protein